MSNKRTVHGGRKSALAVELIPIRRADIVGHETCPDATKADGYGVYIRNPLALFIRAEWAAVRRDSSAPRSNVSRSLALAKIRAALFADELAEHLGAPLIQGGQ